MALIEQYQSSDAVSQSNKKQTRQVLGAFLFIIQETRNASLFLNDNSLQAS